MTKTTIWLLAILLAPTSALADPSTMTVEDIKKCVEEAGPKHSSVQQAKLRTVDAKGTVKESEATLYWKRADDDLSRALIRFSAPPDLRGSAVLVLEKEDEDTDIYMYLPEFRSVRRITTGMMSGSMFGTDFSYEEFERLYGLAQDLDNRRIDDSHIDNRPVFVLESRPKGEESSAYERIVQYVEQERCVPLRSEFFGPSEKLEKVMTIDPTALEQVNGVWLPDQVVMKDVHEGSQTTLSMEKSEIDVDIPERTFSQRSLSRGR